MFKTYTNDIYKALDKQHNIFVMVGNGFDIAVLNRYKSKNLYGKTTSYQDFYEYVKQKQSKLSTYGNILLKKMEEDKSAGKKDWSDFENSIYDLYIGKQYTISELENMIDEYQSYFTEYLNLLVDTDILLQLDSDVKKKNLSIQSLEYFLRDIPYGLLKFSHVSNLKHYDLYNFVFANFNYTSLLDNYLFLDKIQFDPHVFLTVDRNMSIHLNNQDQLKNYTETVNSSYLHLDIIHPHGMQDIPRSILFGIHLDNYDPGRSVEKRLVKGYWAQYDIKYKPYIDQAELIIIYGMSFGASDAWWMEHIFNSIIERNIELLIYKFGEDNEECIKDLFLSRCGVKADEEKAKVRKNIKVKTFKENDTYFLGFEKKI